jgi:CubicO group peptidase (beta-lactamase class C family)
MRLQLARLVALLIPLSAASLSSAGTASSALPFARFATEPLQPLAAPVANAAFAPGLDAAEATPIAGELRIEGTELAVSPALGRRLVDGRDAQRFPALRLRFLTLGQRLVPVERGQMVAEQEPGETASYWRVIPQVGRIWRERGDEGWSRAAFPLMLVNDTENHAHQGLATFLYREGETRAMHLQFTQQTAPYLLSPHGKFWGSTRVTLSPLDEATLSLERERAARELAARLPMRPLAELRAALPAGTLEGFGGPVLPEWQVALGLVYQGRLYLESADTGEGAYPYPEEMRFGVRSVMKSVAAPLALLRLAERYGPEVMEETIGRWVPALNDPKWQRIRFIDAANMATGFGGTGSTQTQPNDINDGYLEADYDGWYTAPSNAQKIAHINAKLSPYPWEPGTVVRYRDQDFYLLGVAVDAYLKAKRGPRADAWRMLEDEVFAAIGIHQAPAVRTREAAGSEGPVWFNAGYYPSLDDLAKIALLFADEGRHGGQQLLHRDLTRAVLEARDALIKSNVTPTDGSPPELYRLGFHYTPFTGSRSQRLQQLPTMSGFGDNEVLIYPGRLISIRAAKAVRWDGGPVVATEDRFATVRAVDRLSPF